MNCQEIYSVNIEAAAVDGRGIARIDGQVVFVPGGIPGERCRVRIVNIGKTAAHAELLAVEEPSPHRIHPDCPYFPRCGGCDFRHMDYELELELKRQRVLDALTRIGGCMLEALPINGAAQQEGYRNKVQYPVQMQHGKPAAGFFSAGTHRVIPIAHCRIQPSCADFVRSEVLTWMRDFRIPAYDERAHTGLIRHIYLRCGAVSGELLVCLTGNGPELPHAQELADRLQRKLPTLRSLVYSPNCKRGNTILGNSFQTIYGPGWIEDTLCGLQFRLSPAAFYQVNHDQAERLYEKALEFAALTGKETVLDLYCGTGTITLCLARAAGRAIGVELVPQAIEDAKENAVRNGLTKRAEFHCMDAGQASQMFAARGEHPEVIVIDPPRKGVSPDVIEAIAAMAPARVVYVSCDPATLARDITRLRGHGYELQAAEAFDLFPRCAHIETAALLVRNNG